jgi:hypothetical protein
MISLVGPATIGLLKSFQHCALFCENKMSRKKILRLITGNILQFFGLFVDVALRTLVVHATFHSKNMQ